jgi:protein gp37
VAETGIEWTDYTFNPWWGCEKVSPGCARCYAEGVSSRYAGPGLWGAGHRFRFFGDKHWAEPLAWNRRSARYGRSRLKKSPGRDDERIRVFCASMADVFEERRDISEERYRLFALIAMTPHLDWQILTKRPEHARDLLTSPWWWAKVEGTAQRLYHERTGEDPSEWLAVHGPLPNVWLGVSIENARHTWRADVLREIPAAVRFISAEPLLGSLFDERSSRGEEAEVRGGSAGALRREGMGAAASEGLVERRDGNARRSVRGDIAAGRDSAVARSVPGLPGDARGRDAVPSVQGDAGGAAEAAGVRARAARRRLDLTGIDWVIVGGESGRGARPMHPDCAREIRDACLGFPAGACDCATIDSYHSPSCAITYAPRPAFFFKQWGEWLPYVDAEPPLLRDCGAGEIVDGHLLPAGLSDHEQCRNPGHDVWWWPRPDDAVVYRRAGKKRSGRVLDGRAWAEFPVATAVRA